MIKNVKENSSKGGLDMNTSKTKIMVFSKKNNVTLTIEIDAEGIEQVNKMKYLGVTLTEDGRSTDEIKI